MIGTDWLRPVIVKINEEGYKTIAVFAIITIVLLFANVYAGLIAFVLTVWCILFFRDPDRVVPMDDNLIISPADGIIQSIQKVKIPHELVGQIGDAEDELTRVSVFMNVFNVHVNRSPISGRVDMIRYVNGKFLNADLDKASENNERQYFVVSRQDGLKLGFVQIAGLVARRIISFTAEGDELEKGERFGLIKFGSRVDVYLPKGVNPLVCVNQISIAGETVIADLNAGLKREYKSQ